MGCPWGSAERAIDPGALIYLMDEHEFGARELEKLLYKESSLLGVSGISNDMRVLLDSADPRAAEAIDLFVYRIGRELGSLAAAQRLGRVGLHRRHRRTRRAHPGQRLPRCSLARAGT